MAGPSAAEFDDDVLEFDQDFKNRQMSIYSEISSQSEPELLMIQECFSRQGTEIDELTSSTIESAVLEAAVAAAVAECKFCVSVGDPRQDDCPLIAISDAFEEMTGYTRAEILGRNCRVLNRNCWSLDSDDFSALRACCRCGEAFTKVVLNRKKSGELFLNLIDLRGLVVAQDPRTGVDLWFLIGIQADVSHLAQDDIPEDHLASLKEVANMIRAKITEELSTFAVNGALHASNGSPALRDIGASCGRESSRENRWVLREPRYRPGNHLSFPSLPAGANALQEIESVDDFSDIDPGDRQLSQFSRQQSPPADVCSDDEAFSMDAFMRQQSAVLDQQGTVGIEAAGIERAIVDAMEDCKFCVSISDPRCEDCPLIAVSDEFEAMTGYSREEILGKNCRILNRNCQLREGDLHGLRESCQTGAPVTKVLVNRRKSGDLFLNLLDLRGITVARKPNGEDLWFLVGVQADVTMIAEEDLPNDHLVHLHKVATSIRAKLAAHLSAVAVAGSMTTTRQQSGSPSCSELWRPVIKARWKPGDQLNSQSPSSSRGVSRQVTGTSCQQSCLSAIGSRQVSAAASHQVSGVSHQQSALSARQQSCGVVGRQETPLGQRQVSVQCSIAGEAVCKETDVSACQQHIIRQVLFPPQPSSPSRPPELPTGARAAASVAQGGATGELPTCRPECIGAEEVGQEVVRILGRPQPPGVDVRAPPANLPANAAQARGGVAWLPSVVLGGAAVLLLALQHRRR